METMGVCCKYFGTYRKKLWRNNGTGATLFVFETKQGVPDSAWAAAPIKIRNQFTGSDEILYSFNVSAMDTGIKDYSIDTPLLIEGVWRVNQKTGKWMLSLKAVEENTNDVLTTVKFLSSEEIGLSYDRAVKLAGKLEGVNLFQLASRDDAKAIIMANSDLDAQEAEALINQLNNTVLERRLFEFLAPAGAAYSFAVRGIKKYGRHAIAKMFADPYRFGGNIGLGFNVCEALAKGFGIKPYDIRRIEGMAQYILREQAVAGNTYIPFGDLMARIHRLERRSPFKSENYVVSRTILKGAGSRSKNLGLDSLHGEEIVFSKKLWATEVHAAQEAERVIRSGKPNQFFTEELISEAERANGIHLANQQKEAIKMAFTSKGGIKILTGGPGTGKTTVLNSIITVYKFIKAACGEEDKLVLFATTARAAQRSAEVTGVPASTVHRGLNYRPYGEGATHKDASDPIDSDFIIIDEVSMMDIELFDIFMTAVKNGTTVLLVGDIHQLESVGPGAVLRDLLKMDRKIVPATMLTEVFRQKGDSLIIDNANKVNNGDIRMDVGKDFKIVNTQSPEESLERVKEIMVKVYDQNDPFRAQILCPARNGVSGINSMNKELQQLLNHNEEKVIYGDHFFKKGDKIMITKNDYASDLYNGDIGIITKIDTNRTMISAEIRGKIYELGADKLPSLVLAYAISIHKSQGSEFQYALCVMPEKPANMLVRNLYYTAITRAKKMAITINEKSKSMERAIVTDKSDARRTMFFEDLKAAFR